MSKDITNDSKNIYKEAVSPKELSAKWDFSISDPNSQFSMTGNGGNKETIKKKGISFKKLLTTAWASLAIATVLTAGLTVNEWKGRVDHINQEIKAGHVDLSKEAIDSKFYVERGANFKDSFLAVKDKVETTVADKFLSFAKDNGNKEQNVSTDNSKKLKM